MTSVLATTETVALRVRQLASGAPLLADVLAGGLVQVSDAFHGAGEAPEMVSHANRWGRGCRCHRAPRTMVLGPFSRQAVLFGVGLPCSALFCKTLAGMVCDPSGNSKRFAGSIAFLFAIPTEHGQLLCL